MILSEILENKTQLTKEVQEFYGCEEKKKLVQRIREKLRRMIEGRNNEEDSEIRYVIFHGIRNSCKCCIISSYFK